MSLVVLCLPQGSDSGDECPEIAASELENDPKSFLVGRWSLLVTVYVLNVNDDDWVADSQLTCTPHHDCRDGWMYGWLLLLYCLRLGGGAYWYCLRFDGGRKTMFRRISQSLFGAVLKIGQRLENGVCSFSIPSQVSALSSIFLAPAVASASF